MVEEEGLGVRELQREIAKLAAPALTGRPKSQPILRTLRLLASERAYEGMDTLVAIDGATAADYILACDLGVARLLVTKERLMQAAAAAAAVLLRVLVVDPAPAFGVQVKRQFGAEGWVIQTARSGAEALARMDPRTNCAVVNPLLPDGCGREWYMKLCEARPGLQCIYLTDLSRDLLPASLRDLDPLVRKSSGQALLRVELKKVQYGLEMAPRPV
jgi:hypothetical protein